MTMFDVSDLLQQAVQARRGWGAVDALRVARDFGSMAPIGRIDWDEAAGEKWVIVCFAAELSLALSVDLPFGMIRRTARATSPLGGVSLLVFESWTGHSFRAEWSILRRAFGGNEARWRTLAAGFSPQTLWFETL